MIWEWVVVVVGIVGGDVVVVDWESFGIKIKKREIIYNWKKRVKKKIVNKDCTKCKRETR